MSHLCARETRSESRPHNTHLPESLDRIYHVSHSFVHDNWLFLLFYCGSGVVFSRLFLARSAAPTSSRLVFVNMRRTFRVFCTHRIHLVQGVYFFQTHLRSLLLKAPSGTANSSLLPWGYLLTYPVSGELVALEWSENFSISLFFSNGHDLRRRCSATSQSRAPPSTPTPNPVASGKTQQKWIPSISVNMFGTVALHALVDEQGNDPFQALGCVRVSSLYLVRARLRKLLLFL